jgi:hypothetical protein
MFGGMVGTTNRPVTTNPSTFVNVVVDGTSSPPPQTCPASWTCSDVGGATPAGGELVGNGSWTVAAGGGDISNPTDQFRFESQPVSGDATLRAHVAAQGGTNAWAKAGLMIRQSADAQAPYYSVLVTPGNGVVVQYRTAQAGPTSYPSRIAGTAPLYVQLVRSGATTFSAATSADGVTWAPAPNSTVTIAGLAGTALSGLAATSHDTTHLSTVTFDTVIVAQNAPPPPPPVICPASWTCSDLGGATPAGSESFGNGSWTVAAGGGDISNPTDEFRFDSQPISADATLRARVLTQGNTNAWAKAGVMIRVGADAQAPYYSVLVTPGNGLVVQYRATQAGPTSYPSRIAGSAPLFVQIVRSGGTTFSAATSADGVTWTPVPNSTVTIAALAGSPLAGLAATSHDTMHLSTVVFDNVTLF